jgi:hypothetical protein
MLVLLALRIQAGSSYVPLDTVVPGSEVGFLCILVYELFMVTVHTVLRLSTS